VHSAVVGRKDTGSETVVAFLELAPDSTLAQAELAAHLAPRLSPYKRPREVWVLPALPVSPNGKVLKKQLQALAQQGAPEGAVRLR
jgi:acyl-coenzyme A synthetase/AMP-(fatty) acid ligase